MAKKRPFEPHLIPDSDLNRCSVSGHPFPTNLGTSLSVAFAEHLLKAQQPGQMSEDSSQAALRVVPEATEYTAQHLWKRNGTITRKHERSRF